MRESRFRPGDIVMTRRLGNIVRLQSHDAGSVWHATAPDSSDVFPVVIEERDTLLARDGVLTREGEVLRGRSLRILRALGGKDA